MRKPSAFVLRGPPLALSCPPAQRHSQYAPLYLVHRLKLFLDLATVLDEIWHLFLHLGRKKGKMWDKGSTQISLSPTGPMAFLCLPTPSPASMPLTPRFRLLRHFQYKWILNLPTSTYWKILGSFQLFSPFYETPLSVVCLVLVVSSGGQLVLGVKNRSLRPGLEAWVGKSLSTFKGSLVSTGRCWIGKVGL